MEIKLNNLIYLILAFCACRWFTIEAKAEEDISR